MWEHGPTKFSTLSADELKGMLAAAPSHPRLQAAHQADLEEDFMLLASLPTEFDWRSASPACMSPVQDQGTTCGSCYAFSSAAMLAERYCIAYNQLEAPTLST